MMRKLKWTFFLFLALYICSLTVFAAEGKQDARAAESAGAWKSEGTMLVLHADLEELKLRESWDSLLGAFQPV